MIPFVAAGLFYYIFQSGGCRGMEWGREKLNSLPVRQEECGIMKLLELNHVEKSFGDLSVIRIYQ